MKKKKKPTKQPADVASIVRQALVDLLIGIVLLLIGKMIE